MTTTIIIYSDSDGATDVLGKQETGLQSLQVLRSILPQLSQSQGSINTVGVVNERREEYERPTISLTTWGERPKRQISIKTDRDYVIGVKGTSSSQISKSNPQPVTVIPPVTVLVQQPPREERKRPSVYKSIETGNTKPIRLSSVDLGRLPIVRGVELKKNVQLDQDLSDAKINLVDRNLQRTSQETSCTSLSSSVPKKQLSENKIHQFQNRVLIGDNKNKYLQFNNVEENKWYPNNNKIEQKENSTNGVIVGTRFDEDSYLKRRQIQKAVPPPPLNESPPKYLFGEQRLKPKQPTLLPPKPKDPREQLLESIRTFGKSTLKKVPQQR